MKAGAGLSVFCMIVKLENEFEISLEANEERQGMHKHNILYCFIETLLYIYIQNIQSTYS